jgi:hypothetical protein
MMNLREVACELSDRLTKLFTKNDEGYRPCYGSDDPHVRREHWDKLVQFHEYFHGETGKGLGASHQTGWTALVINSFDTIERLEHEKK